MTTTIAIALHALAAIIWVGGMFFALLVLRPAAGGFEPADRLGLWSRAFPRFFTWVWMAAVILPATGYWMIFERWGGFANMPLHGQIMHAVGWVMVLIFLHLWFAPYRKFQQAVKVKDHHVAGRYLNQIRWLVATNLALGLINAVAGASGRYWP